VFPGLRVGLGRQGAIRYCCRSVCVQQVCMTQPWEAADEPAASGAGAQVSLQCAPAGPAKLQITGLVSPVLAWKWPLHA
jgi:hypothetical protein